MLLPPKVFLQDSPERTKAKLSWRLLWQSNVHTQVGQSSNLPHVGLQTPESVLEEAGASLPFPMCWNTALWLSVASHTVHDQAVSQKALWKNIKTLRHLHLHTSTLHSWKNVVKYESSFCSSYLVETVHVCPDSRCAGHLWWYWSPAKQ